MDDFSKLWWVSILEYKFDAFNEFNNFKVLAEVEKKREKIKRFQTVFRGAFAHEGFKDFVIRRGYGDC